MTKVSIKQIIRQATSYVPENDEFKNDNIFDIPAVAIKFVAEHSDTKQKLEGKVFFWNEVQCATKEFGAHFSQM